MKSIKKIISSVLISMEILSIFFLLNGCSNGYEDTHTNIDSKTEYITNQDSEITTKNTDVTQNMSPLSTDTTHSEINTTISDTFPTTVTYTTTSLPITTSTAIVDTTTTLPASSVTCISPNPDKDSIFKLSFGMSLKEVQDILPSYFVTNGGSHRFDNAYCFEYDGLICCTFKDDKLTEYSFTTNDNYEDSYLLDKYDDIKNQLIDYYGSPEQDIIIWKKSATEEDKTADKSTHPNLMIKNKLIYETKFSCVNYEYNVEMKMYACALEICTTVNFNMK